MSAPDQAARAAHRQRIVVVDGEGAIVYRQACKLGCEGIVSKRLGSPYRSGRSAHWVKVKKPERVGQSRARLRRIGAFDIDHLHLQPDRDHHYCRYAALMEWQTARRSIGKDWMRYVLRCSAALRICGLSKLRLFRNKKMAVRQLGNRD